VQAQTPVRQYRPTKHFDGEGSNSEIGSATQLWVDVQVHGPEIEFLIDADEDLEIGDFILIPTP